MEIPMVSKTRDMLEGLVKEGSFKWLTKRRNMFDDDILEMERSPSAGTNSLTELSMPANVVVRRCSKILNLSMGHLREKFDVEAPDPLRHHLVFARNFLEYCCFMALTRLIQVPGYLDDCKFRRLTFDMMVAWEFPAASTETLPNMDDDATVGMEAFSRIATAIPIVANVVVSDKIFEVLANTTNYRLHFPAYDKYLVRLERAIRKLHTQSESSLVSSVRSGRGEKILEVDGTVTSQPVLEHVGTSTWPGRLTLTDHALYFEALRVVSYDKAKIYDLADDLQQVVKPELTGPLGTRLFDKAIFYKSVTVSKPVIIEFPELKGHTRRDYWLAIVREILHAHRFISKFKITGPERDEVLLKAIFGIVRLQALKEMTTSAVSLDHENFLMFNVCDQLPRGDIILDNLANMLTLRTVERGDTVKSENGMYSVSARSLASHLGLVFGLDSDTNDIGLLVGEISVGEMTPLEKAVKQARESYENIVLARSTVSGVKIEGVDTNLAVMKELLSPAREIGDWLVLVLYWDDPLKSSLFCLVFTYIIFRGWMCYAFSASFAFVSLCMLLTRHFGRGRPVEELKVIAPPAMNTMEQLLVVQNAISQVEELIQRGNIVLLKCRALLLSVFPQASEILAVALFVLSLVVALLPFRFIVMLAFLEAFTRYSPIRRSSTERWTRRLRDWWCSIPAAPVLLEKAFEDKKKK